MSRRRKQKARMLTEHLTDTLLFILAGLLWLSIWFGTDLLQSYY